MSFNGLLDGFGKLHRFEISNNKLCFNCVMMDTNFYKQSIEKGKIVQGIMFQDTSPPGGYSGIENVKGPNDNVFVTPIKNGDNYFMYTDSQTILKIDPFTLSVESTVGK